MATLIFGGVSHAQSEQDPRFRYSFSNDNAPPYIHFRLFLQSFRFETDARSKNSTLSSLGFSKAEFPEISIYFDELYDQLELEKAQGIERIACYSGAANLSGLQIRTVFNSFDDLQYALSAKFLAIASAELAARNHPDFIDRMVNLDGSFRVFSTEHRLAWGEDDVEIQRKRADYCRGIERQLRE